MAWQLDSYCNDGYYYIYVADALENGDTQPLLTYLNLNVYPTVLVWGHRLGLSWAAAGELWGVVAGTLLVLPLFGWIARVFNRRVALVSCLLYSVHPEFIELAPEPIRDTTFWLLLTLALYGGVRAAQEKKLRWFAWGGIAWALAIHTRSEGWLLALPLVGWVGAEFRSPFRRRLLAGSLVACAMIPAFLVAANHTILPNSAEWSYGRLNHFVVGWQWVRTRCGWGEPEALVVPCPQPQGHGEESSPPGTALRASGESPQLATGQRIVPAAIAGQATNENESVATSGSTVESPGQTIALPPVPAKTPLGLRAVKYFKRLCDAVEIFSLAYLAIGLWCLRPRPQLRVLWPLYAFALAVCGAIWVLYSAHDMTNSRYFLTAFLVLIPFAGAGLDACVCRLSEQEWSLLGRRLAGPVMAGVFATGVWGVGWGDALSSRHGHRIAEVEFATLLKTHLDHGRGIVVDHDAKRIGFHADNAVPRLIDVSCCGIYQTLQADTPDALVLSYRRINGTMAELEAATLRLGLQAADDQLPEELRGEYRLFVRRVDVLTPGDHTNGPGRSLNNLPTGAPLAPGGQYPATQTAAGDEEVKTAIQ